jgi:uncharacterized lipoprotein YmbA
MKRVACLVLAGCALTSRAPPLELRTFTAEPPPRAHAAMPPRAQLRLGRVTASANLRYAIVHRVSSVEVEPYETLRWTELPDSYVRRALERALFDERPVSEVVSGDAPTLEVEVLAFEQTARGGLVTLRYELRDDRGVIARGTISSERPAGSPAIEAVVAAIRDAMIASTEELAGRIERALLERASHAPEQEAPALH